MIITETAKNLRGRERETEKLQKTASKIKGKKQRKREKGTKEGEREIYKRRGQEKKKEI